MGMGSVRNVTSFTLQKQLWTVSGCLPGCKVGYRADKQPLQENQTQQPQLQTREVPTGYVILFPHYEDNYALALAAESCSRQKCSVSAEETQQFCCLPLDTLPPEFNLFPSSPSPKKIYTIPSPFPLTAASPENTKMYEKATKVGKQSFWSIHFFPLPV